MYYVYVLRGEVTGRHYTGSAADVAERLRRHNAGDTHSTRHGVPSVLVHTEAHTLRSEAVRRERFLKTGRGREELQGLLGISG